MLPDAGFEVKREVPPPPLPSTVVRREIVGLLCRKGTPAIRVPGISSCFVYLTRLPAKIRRLAEICGLALVLNSQTPRLTRRVFHNACACLVSAKKR